MYNQHRYFENWETILDKDFKVTFLGISDASFSLRAVTSACLVEVGKTKILVDAGVGALRQLLKVGANPDMLDAVLLTHWHPDHWAGLPALVKFRNRLSSLPVFGPEPGVPLRFLIGKMFPGVFNAFNPVREGSRIGITDIRAEAFTTFHKVASIGWEIAEHDTNGRRAVFSGDTRPGETVINAARKADLLVYEATFLDKHLKRAVKCQHSTATEAAYLAEEAKVGGLALNHISRRYTKKSVRDEVEPIYPGAIIPSPLTSISVDRVPDESKKEEHGWAHLILRKTYVK